MKLLQFSTSHYCRKARLALGFKRIPYTVENLTPGAHILRIKPMSGLTTLPVLLPELPNHPTAIADSTQIFHFLERYQPMPSYFLEDGRLQSQAWAIEDWLDESVGVATRFVYYHFRSGEGKQLDPSLASQLVIRTVRWQYGINAAAVGLAEKRLSAALTELAYRWQDSAYLVGDRLSIADLAAAALLSPLARVPSYRQTYPWLFKRLISIHQTCQEPLPPGLEDEE
jgi:glutathione S-transferase